METTDKQTIHKKKVGLNWYVHCVKAGLNDFAMFYIELSHYGTKKHYTWVLTMPLL